MGADRYGYDPAVWMLERQRERGRGCESENEGKREGARKPSCYEPDCYHETGSRTLMSNVHL